MALVTSTLDSVIVVWHVAVNAGDADAAAAACSEDVVLGTPEGRSQGRDELKRWVSESGVRLMPKEAYDVPGGIVVAQEATWPAGDGGSEPKKIFTTFGLRDGEISSILRFETLDEAKAAQLAA